MTKVHPESYLEANTAQEVKYPYQTYTFSSEDLELGSEGFYLDVDIYDEGTSYMGILGVENSLKKALDRHNLMTDEAYFRFRFDGSNSIPTQKDDLKRRNVRFYIKIYWR